MSKNNFHCKKCEHDFFVTEYRTKYKEEGAVYSDKWGRLKCPECESEDVEWLRTKEGYGVPFGINIGKFSSASAERKQEILDKRQDEHFKKKGKDLHEHIERNFTGNSKDLY